MSILSVYLSVLDPRLGFILPVRVKESLVLKGHQNDPLRVWSGQRDSETGPCKYKWECGLHLSLTPVWPVTLPSPKNNEKAHKPFSIAQFFFGGGTFLIPASNDSVYVNGTSMSMFHACGTFLVRVRG